MNEEKITPYQKIPKSPPFYVNSAGPTSHSGPLLERCFRRLRVGPTFYSGPPPGRCLSRSCESNDPLLVRWSAFLAHDVKEPPPI